MKGYLQHAIHFFYSQDNNGDEINTENLKKAFPRLRDPTSGRGSVVTQPRKIIFEGLCKVSMSRMSDQKIA